MTLLNYFVIAFDCPRQCSSADNPSDSRIRVHARTPDCSRSWQSIKA